MACASRLNVLRNGPARQRVAHMRIVSLFSFALTHWIERQDHKTFQRQIRRQPLPFRLSLLCMAGLQKHAGISPRLIGPVQICGHVEVFGGFRR